MNRTEGGPSTGGDEGPQQTRRLCPPKTGQGHSAWPIITLRNTSSVLPNLPNFLGGRQKPTFVGSVVTGEDALTCDSKPGPSWHHHPLLSQKINRGIRGIPGHSMCSGSFTEVNAASDLRIQKCPSDCVLVFVVVHCSGENTYSFAQILLHGPQSLVRAEFTQEIFTKPLARCRG